jgi:hypothetical protein
MIMVDTAQMCSPATKIMETAPRRAISLWRGCAVRELSRRGKAPALICRVKCGAGCAGAVVSSSSVGQETSAKQKALLGAARVAGA